MYTQQSINEMVLAARQRNGGSREKAIDEVFKKLATDAARVWGDIGYDVVNRIEQRFFHQSTKRVSGPELESHGDSANSQPNSAPTPGWERLTPELAKEIDAGGDQAEPANSQLMPVPAPTPRNGDQTSGANSQGGPVPMRGVPYHLRVKYGLDDEVAITPHEGRKLRGELTRLDRLKRITWAERLGNTILDGAALEKQSLPLYENDTEIWTDVVVRLEEKGDVLGLRLVQKLISDGR